MTAISTFTAFRPDIPVHPWLRTLEVNVYTG